MRQNIQFFLLVREITSLNEIKYVVNINVFTLDEFDPVPLGCWSRAVTTAATSGKIVLCSFAFPEKAACIRVMTSAF